MVGPFPWREAPAAEFAVIGDPIGHSLSPKMQGAALQALGLPHRYVAIHVPVGEVPDALDHLAGLGYQGINVTVPHKETVLAWCREVDPFARRVGAANTLRISDRFGLNTDALGFLDVLHGLGVSAPAKTLVLGAGGSSRALTAMLADEGYDLALWNRTPERACELIDSLGLGLPIVATPDARGFDLVINTTSASLGPERIAVEWGRSQVAIDLAYGAGPTPFLQDAAAHGARIEDGRSLLVAQGARSLEFWLGVVAPREVMAAALA